jgi:hypothetical protein
MFKEKIKKKLILKRTKKKSDDVGWARYFLT